MKNTFNNKKVRFNNVINFEKYIADNNEKTIVMDDNFINDCKKSFVSDINNNLHRNSIVAIGSMISTTNSKQLNEIDHLFLNTIKTKDTKATNQGHSGRCWIFAGMNMFRHNLIKALKLSNFEFSETYIFFWDKFERCNTFLNWVSTNKDKIHNYLNQVKPQNIMSKDEFNYFTNDYITDGGWWNMFSNLVEKYGLIPTNAMKETWQSVDSDDLNQVLSNVIKSAALDIIRNKTQDSNYHFKTMDNIYSILVKFLGTPPKEFRWTYMNEDDESVRITNLNPLEFKAMTTGGINLNNEYVVLTNLPRICKENQLYRVKSSSNMVDGQPLEFLNVNIRELTKYATKSVLSGHPVWFASDITKDFNYYHSILDNNIFNMEDVFKYKETNDKGYKLLLNNLDANHAMVLIGVNMVHNKFKPESWQVENSWGYMNDDTPGQDGFLYMSHEWFQKNVIQIVIHRNYLSRTICNLFNMEPLELNPWDTVAPSLLNIKTSQIPQKYKRLIKKDYK